jgi:SAM-dependent methyltransferase
MKKVNLACGSVYIKQSDWINLDYQPMGDGVIKSDLLGTLPFKQGSVSLVYSSHFLEHIPRSKVAHFLSECFRVLEPGGTIRLVLPDLEEICSQYLYNRQRSDHKKADFCVVEMIDQCVRLKSGGELGLLYKFYSQSYNRDLEMVEYIRSFNGEVLCKAENHNNSPLSKIASLLKEPKLLWGKIAYHLEQYYIRMIVSLLPKAFRTQNVSLATVGERHHWVWDFRQIQQALESVGFIATSRCSFNTSMFPDFPFQSLDMDANGFPRKGLESMYIEAKKPN